MTSAVKHLCASICCLNVQARETGAAKERLLAKLAEDHSQDWVGGRGRGGRGRGRGRRRRGHDNDEDDGTSLTLEEWEAQQKGRALAGACLLAIANRAH